MSDLLILRREISADEIEICPSGELSQDALTELERALEEALRGRHGRIALSLERLARLSSSAIGKIFHFKKRCDESGRRFVIRRCNPELLRLLKMVKFDTLMDVEA